MFKQLKEDINIVFDRDPAARNKLEVVTTYPGFHAVLLHRLNHWLEIKSKVCFSFSRVFFTLADWCGNTPRCGDREALFY